MTVAGTVAVHGSTQRCLLPEERPPGSGTSWTSLPRAPRGYRAAGAEPLFPRPGPRFSPQGGPRFGSAGANTSCPGRAVLANPPGPLLRKLGQGCRLARGCSFPFVFKYRGSLGAEASQDWAFPFSSGPQPTVVAAKLCQGLSRPQWRPLGTTAVPCPAQRHAPPCPPLFVLQGYERRAPGGAGGHWEQRALSMSSKPDLPLSRSGM